MRTMVLSSPREVKETETRTQERSVKHSRPTQSRQYEA